MMVEGDGLDPEQTPPASTRWEQAAPDEDDDALVPPYAPARGPSAGNAEPAAVTPGAADTVEPEPPAVAEETFPFDADTGPDEEAFPFDAESAPDEEAFPFEASPGGTGAGEGPAMEAGAAEAEAEADDFPVGAFDIEGIEEPEEREEPASVAGPAGVAREPSLAGRGAEPAVGIAAELADRLERLAARLRSEGTDAVDAELESNDAFSRLMGAMLAGYLAGRRE